MADIFLSYAREDVERARGIAGALQAEGWSIFWDRRIPPGREWADYIEEKINESHVVVVLWSPHSVASKWVKIEAGYGRDRDLLIPITIAPTTIPFAFRHLQSADLCEWQPGNRSLEFEEVLTSIERLAPKPAALNRPAASETPKLDERVNPVDPVLVQPSGYVEPIGKSTEPTDRPGDWAPELGFAARARIWITAPRSSLRARRAVIAASGGVIVIAAAIVGITVSRDRTPQGTTSASTTGVSTASPGLPAPDQPVAVAAATPPAGEVNASAAGSATRMPEPSAPSAASTPAGSVSRSSDRPTAPSGSRARSAPSEPPTGAGRPEFHERRGNENRSKLDTRPDFALDNTGFRVVVSRF